MPDGTTAIHHDEHVEERFTIEALFGGSMAGGIAAAAGVALTIIGLAGLFPRMLLSVATIAAGCAFLFQGAAVMGRISDLLHEATEGKMHIAELGAGTTAETLSGCAGIVLGVLGILNVLPAILIPCAAIAFGAGLILGAGTNMRINALEVAARHDQPIAHRLAREAVRGATGLQVLGGLAAITLGIIALAQIDSLIVTLVAILVVSGAFLLTDTAVAGRMLSIFAGGNHH